MCTCQVIGADQRTNFDITISVKIATIQESFTGIQPVLIVPAISLACIVMCAEPTGV